MHLTGLRTGAAVAAAVLASCLATAGEPRPGSAEESDLGFGAYGPELQDYWIAATQFAPPSGSEPWSEVGNLYFFNSQASGIAAYKAQVELPAGGVITGLQCLFYDVSPSAGIVGLWKNQYDSIANVPGATTNLGSVASQGSSGYQDPAVVLEETVRYQEAALQNIYTLDAVMPPGADLRLRGCRLFWRRSVSPGPATATFADVPTTHPQFRFVEALAAAGITGGCGVSSFCPDAPLTRGQMAVFLSAALGLHFPY